MHYASLQLGATDPEVLMSLKFELPVSIGKKKARDSGVLHAFLASYVVTELASTILPKKHAEVKKL